MVKDEKQDLGVTKKTMQLAEILSDLTLLRACQDQTAALRLVSVRPSSNPQTSTATSSFAGTADQPSTTPDANVDTDLGRAKDLVELHYSVREAHKRGELSRGLEDARAAVRRAVEG